jgi:hypothetical protein
MCNKNCAVDGYERITWFRLGCSANDAIGKLIGWRSTGEKAEIPSASLRTGSSAAMKNVDVRDDNAKLDDAQIG